MKRLLKRSFSILLALFLVIQINAGVLLAETATLYNEDAMDEDALSSILKDDVKKEEEDGPESKEEDATLGETEIIQPEDTERPLAEPLPTKDLDLRVTADLLAEHVYDVSTLGDWQTAWGNVSTNSGDTVLTILNDINLGSQLFTVPTGANVTILSEASSLLTKSSGRHFVVNGTLTLANVSLDGSNSGGGIQVNGGGRLNLESGSVIQNCTAANGGGVYLNNGELHLSAANAYIKENSASGQGAGVYMTNNSTFIMDHGNITENRAYTVDSAGFGRGGGVFISNNSSFVMKDGSITNNTARSGSGSGFSHGGGVYVSDGSDFTMQGGSIANNTSRTGSGSGWGYGGGVSILSDASFLMEGGTISQNKAASASSSGNGGGVYLDGGSFVMNHGSSVKDNYGGYGVSGDGGGVYVKSGTFQMNPGSDVSGNYASSKPGGNGGGIYVASNNYYDFEKDESISSHGTFTMTGGSVLNNLASSEGGGVYTLDYDYVFVDSNAVFNGNSASRLATKLSQADRASHDKNIFTSSRSEDTQFLYNNYDINYVNYIVTFHDEDDSIVNQSLAFPGGNVDLPEGPSKRYKFDQWVPQSPQYTLSDLSNVGRDMAFMATYTNEIHQVSVTFESNGGGNVEAQTVNYGDYVKNPGSLEFTGYTFEGWYRDENFEEKWSFEEDVATKNTILYAKWTKEVVDEAVVETGDGGDASDIPDDIGGNDSHIVDNNGSNGGDNSDETVKNGGDSFLNTAKNSLDAKKESGKQINDSESIQTKQSEPPQTGDAHRPWLWIGSLLLSSAISVSLLVWRALSSKRKKDKG